MSGKKECSECHGTGVINLYHKYSRVFIGTSPCSCCNDTKCPECNGTGVINIYDNSNALTGTSPCSCCGGTIGIRNQPSAQSGK